MRTNATSSDRRTRARSSARGAVLLPTWNSAPSGSRAESTSSTAPSAVPLGQLRTTRRRRGREARDVEVRPALAAS